MANRRLIAGLEQLINLERGATRPEKKCHFFPADPMWDEIRTPKDGSRMK